MATDQLVTWLGGLTLAVVVIATDGEAAGAQESSPEGQASSQTEQTGSEDTSPGHSPSSKEASSDESASEDEASESGGGESEGPLRRPALQDFVKAEYPDEAREAGIEGIVTLILTIDAEGNVVEAKPQDGPGHGLDEAARKAAMDFRFRPARRGDEPVRARIRYRYSFELPDEHEGKKGEDATPGPRRIEAAARTPQHQKPETDEQADRGRIRGTVQLPGSDDPAVGAEVTLVGPEDGETVVRTDDAGQFRSEPLPPGKYRVRVEADGSGAAKMQTYVVAGETTKIEVQLTGGDDEAIEVTVRGESEGEQLERSARAVEVIETEQAGQRSQDMGEVVSSEEGADVRRTGGLGSGSRFSLNGLNDNQVRFFLDGVPLAYAGFPFGMANVPVNLVERVDIYSGVVPVRFGADALGGAVDLVTPAAPADDGMRASYQVGSFDTHRLTLSGRTVDEENGWYARAHGFFDYSANDYPVDVEVADASGQISDATVRRFHDTYRAAGGGVEVGVTNREWADELSARGFVSDYAKDFQHNLIMSVPYGEVAAGETVGGGVVRYKHDLESPLSLDLAVGYNHTRGWLEDTAKCRYDWFGRCVSDRERRGELGEFPSDHRIWENAGFARLNGTWRLADAHELRLTVAPTYVARTGEDRIEQAGSGRDPIEANRDLMDLVTGVEYQANLFDGRLENIAFAKDYLQIATTDETLPSGKPVNNDRTTHRVGFGDSLRYRFTNWLSGKTSYEWATRLPTAEEMFGNGVRIQPNSALEPERSHNANLELSVDGLEGTTGSWRGSATGFLRRSNQLVVLIGGADSFSYQNVYDARSTGFEAAAGWTSPGGWLALDVSSTYVDLRNVSDQGAFEEFQGDRIPNRPYLFGHTQARLQDQNVFAPGDVVSATWQSRYVHEYYRGWESLGRTEFKQVIPAQWRQSVAVGYEVENDLGALSTTVEVQNLTDQKSFDFFGVQRPGRAFYLKTTLEL